MGELTSTATCRASRGADPATGEVVTAAQVAARVGYAIGLAEGHAGRVLEVGYTPTNLAVLTRGVGPDGRKLPSHGYMVARRLGWAPGSPDGLYLSDRFRRCAEEAAIRKLRQAAWVDQLVVGLVATWPERPKKRTSDEWDALWTAVPDGTDKATVRNRTRQIAGHLAKHGRLPASVCDLEPDPTCGRALLLAAADRQLVRVERPSSRLVVLHVQLPTVVAPASQRDWTWHALPIDLPAPVPDDARVHTPTLRLVDGRVRADVPWTQHVADIRADGHVRAVGFDWGVNTLVTATIGDLNAAGDVVVDGKPAHFTAPGVAAKTARIRRHRERLAGRRDRIDQLLTGLDATDLRHQPLIAKRDLLQTEIDRASRRQRQLNLQVAWAAARWLVDLAVANGATVIYAEDLRTMEARGLGRRVNVRASNTVRGRVLAAVRHLASRAGITVVEVPARDTSKLCPRCHTRLTHVPSPDRMSERGHKWAICHGCGFSGDRDHAAAERIVSRGLASQEHVRKHRTTGALRATKHQDVKVRRSRRPASSRPTTSRRSGSTRPAPANGTLVLQPASGGTAPNGPATSGREVSSTTVLTPRQAHRKRVSRRACGCGFHLHVHASPTGTRPDWRAHAGHLANRRSRALRNKT